MNFNVSKVCVFFILFFFFSLFFSDADPADNKWKLMGKTRDRKFLVYKAANVENLTETYVRLRLKRELSEEGIEKFKQDYYASLIKAEAEAGEKLQGSPDELLGILIRREKREYTVDIDCASNEMRVQPEKMAAVNFVVVENIESGTTMEKIRNEVCRKQD